MNVYKWTVISLFVFFWLAFGLVQEKLMKSLKFPFPFFVTLIHQTVLSVGSYLLMRFQKDDFSSKLDDNKRQLPPYRYYCALAFLVVILRSTINVGLKFVDFNTKTIFASARTIPVMLGGLAFGKHYDLIDYIVAIALCIGLYFFTSGDAQTSASFDLFGVFLMTVSTCSDAIRLNLSEKLMKPSAAMQARSVVELLFYSETMGLLMILPMAVVSGDVKGALLYFYQGNWTVLMALILLGSLAFGGSVTMMQTVELTSAYTLSLIGIARMALSIGVSIVIFGKAVSVNHFIGGTLFIAGLLLRVQAKKNQNEKKR